MSIQSVLIKLANAFITEVKQNLDSSDYPSGADRAGRDYAPIEETIERGNPNVTQSSGEIEVAIGSEKAPYTKMYEFGKGAYEINAKDKDMVFAKEYWPQYKPPPPAPLFFIFQQVTHPEFEGRPFIKPVVDAFDSKAQSVLTKDEIKKLFFENKPQQEVW